MTVRWAALAVLLGCSSKSAPPAPAIDPTPVTEPAPPDAAIVDNPGVTGADKSKQELALKLDQEGDELFAAKKFAEATAKYRAAVETVPDPAYLFDLCQSLYGEGKLAEAKTTCTTVLRFTHTAELDAKASQQLELISHDAQKQGLELR